MRPTELHGVERQRFPLPVDASHPAEWYVRRRLALVCFFFGLGLGLCSTWLVILCGRA